MTPTILLHSDFFRAAFEQWVSQNKHLWKTELAHLPINSMNHYFSGAETFFQWFMDNYLKD